MKKEDIIDVEGTDYTGIQEPAKMVTETKINEFRFEVNEDGELRISNEYEPTIFVFQKIEAAMLSTFLKACE